MPLQLVTLQPLVLSSYHVNVGEKRLIAGVLHADPPRLEVVAEELGAVVVVIGQQLLSQLEQLLLQPLQSSLTIALGATQTLPTYNMVPHMFWWFNGAHGTEKADVL